MEEWKEYKLGDILNFRRGHDLPKTAMKEGNIPVAGSNGIIGFHNEATSISPCITIGRSGNVGKPYIYERCWAHNTVLYIDDFKGNNPLYLFYLLKTLPLSSFGGGSAVPTLNRNHIHPLIIKHTTDLQIQNKISSILKSLDDKIGLNKRINDNFFCQKLLEIIFIWMITTLINDNLEKQAQALFKSWFVDFEPFKGEEFVESELGMIPRGWRVGNIYQYVSVIYGAPYKSSMFNDKGNGSPLIRIRDLKTFSPQFFTPEVLPQTVYIETGDVVAGMDAEFVPCLWLGEKGVLNQRCCKFVPKLDGISNYFVLFWLKPELEFVQSYKTGTTVSHLGKSDIDKFIVVIHPLEEVRKYSVIAESMIKDKIRLAKEILNLATLRDTLLPRLMSGELKVNDVTV